MRFIYLSIANFYQNWYLPANLPNLIGSDRSFTNLYSITIVGPAKKENFAINLQATGETYGDPFEVSTMRREDHDLIKDKSGEFVEILQCNNAASSRTPRGHQFPGAFLQHVGFIKKLFFLYFSPSPIKYSK